MFAKVSAVKCERYNSFAAIIFRAVTMYAFLNLILDLGKVAKMYYSSTNMRLMIKVSVTQKRTQTMRTAAKFAKKFFKFIGF